ncbi:unnamed protein product [Spirodela intermedia]|uniref:Uncharacterized protein n=2 Tax=Spirodela intermedia TaxID=51605 RepID=A0A7I8K7H8_SPIIN|nr:unnamed protein product [Spirodela intermedia]CAA6657571.1 unnamed protein product [Spirodela intermedia]CAA7393653.1 unnamed protein product [Spirodela intermedia]
MALDRDKKVMAMTPLIVRFMAAPMLFPCARSLSGKISEQYTHAIGPSPMEKNATNERTVAMESATAQMRCSPGW